MSDLSVGRAGIESRDQSAIIFLAVQNLPAPLPADKAVGKDQGSRYAGPARSGRLLHEGGKASPSASGKRLCALLVSQPPEKHRQLGRAEVGCVPKVR